MEIRSLLGTPPVCLLLLLATSSISVLVNGDCKNFDFEDGAGALAGWQKTGNAFDSQPTYGDNANIRDPKVKSNVHGDWWIGTFENRPNSTSEGGYFKGDYPRGTLTSPKFLITGPNINFLFGGGCDAGKLRAELLVRGKAVRQALAIDCRDKMRRRQWDVSAFKNRIAQIRLIDGSRRGHVNFDDFRGNFSCSVAGVPLNDEDDFTVVDEQLPSTDNSDGALITGTEDEYDAMSNSSDPQNSKDKDDDDDDIITDAEDPYFDIHNSSGVLQSSSKTEKNIHHSDMPPGGKSKAVLTGVPNVKAPKSAAKRADNTSQSGSNNNTVPTNDDLRNLTCKDFVVEIKTGKPWDNDFLFISNENYQATRRELEVKVLSVYEDDKDFRGAFFNKFSSSEEPDGIKAYFILRFRAYGKFLGKLVDALGKGNVTAAGCYLTPPVVSHCVSPCSSACAPACQPSCCQVQVTAQPPPQPVYQPPAPPMPPPPPPAAALTVPSPALYQPAAQQWNPQSSQMGQLQYQYPAPPPPAPAQISPSMVWPGPQCGASCASSCAPSCSQMCCNYNNYKRTAAIRKLLKKQKLQEEKH